MAEIPGEVQHAHMSRIAGGQIIQDLAGPVAGAVIYEDEPFAASASPYSLVVW